MEAARGVGVLDGNGLRGDGVAPLRVFDFVHRERPLDPMPDERLGDVVTLHVRRTGAECKCLGHGLRRQFARRHLFDQLDGLLDREPRTRIWYRRTFTVPAGTAVYFQPLDAKGRALQWMRSWVTAQPGEVRAWRELWYPLVGTKGLTLASSDVALSLHTDGANLVDWSELAHFTNTNPTFQYMDPATNLTQRFYRARLMP